MLQGYKKFIALFGFILSIAAYAATPHYSDLKFSDSDGGDAAESFTPDTPKIFLNAGLVDMPSGTKIASVWICEDSHGVAPPNYKIDSVELTVGSIMNVATFSLSKPNTGWPIGTYRVDLMIDGKASGSAHFKIEAE